MSITNILATTYHLPTLGIEVAQDDNAIWWFRPIGWMWSWTKVPEKCLKEMPQPLAPQAHPS